MCESFTAIGRGSGELKKEKTSVVKHKAFQN